MKKNFSLLLAVTLLIVAACNKNLSPRKPGELPGHLVIHWNDVAYKAFGGTAYQHSLMASRINAMMHIAIHDALNGIEEKYEQYAFHQKDAGADPQVSVSYAAYAVLMHEIPGKQGFLDSALQQALSGMDLENESAIRGMELGKEAAQAILQKRYNDGSAGDVVGIVEPSEEPGIYQPVPPFNFAFALHWENVKPFGIQVKDQFRCPEPPSINSQQYTEGFNEVKLMGVKANSNRTDDQTAVSRFWYEFSEAGWNRVAKTAIANKNLNLLETARLYALVDIALADAYIAGWDSKIHYNFWRPFTAIRNAGSDGNGSTEADAAWESFEVTPPIHDYPSTHSALGNAAATVLARLLGDQNEFTFTSPTGLPGKDTRSFTSFLQAADENAESRVCAGIHFRFSCDAGQELGNKIGNWVVDHVLKPKP